MPRNKKNTRKIYIKRFSKYRVARILGMKPNQLTSQGSYVTKKKGKTLSTNKEV